MVNRDSSTGPDSKIRFHHVGIVVSSIAECIDGYRAALLADWDGRIFQDPIQSVRVTFLSPPSGTDTLIELVEPMGTKSPASAFAAQGGGLHHVCYEVDNLEIHMEYMRSQRARLVRFPQPAVAFEGRRIAWMLTADQLLMEFLERRAPIPPGGD